MVSTARNARRRALSVWVGLLFLVAACGGPAIPPTLTPVPADAIQPTTSASADYGVPKNPKVAAMGPVELHVLFAADYYKVAPVVAVADAFMRMYPNVKIKLDGTEWDQIPARIKTEIAEGSDSIDLAHQHAFVMGAQGFAEPIDDLWPQLDESSLVPGSILDTTWKGVHYGVPLDVNALFTIYRKDLYQKAGLPEPGPNWTYEQARSDARKLTQGDVFGTAISNSAWAMSGHVRANGGSITDSAGEMPTLDSPANIAMMQYMGDLINADRVSSAPLAPGQRYDPVVRFWEGEVAFLWTGPFDIGRIRNEAPAAFKAACPNLSCIGTTTLPHGLHGDQTGSVQGGGSLFIPKGSRHKEVAFELMRWYLSPVYQMAMVTDQARYPVVASLYRDPRLAGDPLIAPYIEQLKTAYPYRLEANAAGNQAWQDAVTAILSGAPAAETLHAAQQRALAPTPAPTP